MAIVTLQMDLGMYKSMIIYIYKITILIFNHKTAENYINVSNHSYINHKALRAVY